MLKRSAQRCALSFVLFTAIFPAVRPCRAEFATGPSTAAETLPDGPEPQREPGTTNNPRLGERILNELDPGSRGVAKKWDVTINKGVVVQPFSKRDKLHYAALLEVSPTSLFTAAYSAGYEHLRDTDPHFGSDRAGFGERFGAASFRQGVNRIFGDGVFPALLHEDPRYYRVAEGSLWHRSSRSAVQTLIRSRDDGTKGINYSGIAGHALSEGLPITFYPQKSAKATVVLGSFGTALLADAGLKLFREFLPDVFEATRLTTRSK